jgi:hypothetical protein
MASDEIPHTLPGFGPDAPTVAEALNKVRVIRRLLAEVGFPHAGAGEEGFDFDEKLLDLFLGHAPTLVAKTTKVNRYQSRHGAGGADAPKYGMAAECWRIRLAQALADSGRSANAVSTDARCAPNYLHGLLTQGKEPTLDRFLRICRALNVSPSYVLTGSQVTRDTEAVVAALEDHPEKRAAILALIGKASQAD